MKNVLKKRLFAVTLTQVAIFIISFLFYRNISLVSYINISFYFTAIFLLLALLIYTIQSGFYDVFSRSLNLAFSRGKDKRRFDEVPGLSQLITVNQRPLLFYGLVTGLLMMVALLAYYF
ncbi:DUF3899 domain-containing protein [Neobacillus vireti]|uniref:DUF3899 domain-containing protein n=1 Tax=Neobacillus vireti LMG 21834 TaxID=1131730 RepID=A0AB94IG52_9BACI|nr:DUF3899 domain-containing protein [Neobacillus vireti]ETI66090.1 hypothetical protein BAVI_24398 [Neobacillus vireti LMG 21834]